MGEMLVNYSTLALFIANLGYWLHEVVLELRDMYADSSALRNRERFGSGAEVIGG